MMTIKWSLENFCNERYE